MAGYLDWDHLSVVLRVQRTRWDKYGEVEFVHNRCFACNLRPEVLNPDQWLAIVLRYWACTENGCHDIWDVAFEEDEHPWIKAHDRGPLNVMLLRRIAHNLVTLFRGVTQRSEERRATPWATVIRWFYIALVSVTAEDVDGLRVRGARCTAR